MLLEAPPPPVPGSPARGGFAHLPGALKDALVSGWGCRIRPPAAWQVGVTGAGDSEGLAGIQGLKWALGGSWGQFPGLSL